MASVEQHSSSWDRPSVPIVPTLMSEEQFENWLLANREVRGVERWKGFRYVAGESCAQCAFDLDDPPD